MVTQTPNGPVVTRTSFADEYHNGNKIPPGLIDPVAKAIESYYPKPNVAWPGVSGYRHQQLLLQRAAKQPGHKVFWTAGLGHYNRQQTDHIGHPARQPGGSRTIIGICPIYCTNVDTDSNNSQITDVWNISPETINEARIGYTDQLNFYVDQTLNKGFPAKLGWQFAKADDFPTINISGNCCNNALERASRPK